MKIALLVGAFNPPHIGHIWIAQQVLDFTDVDEVWLVPNFGHKYYGINPHKKTAPAADRLAMTRYLESPRIKVSTLEVDHETTGQTIELLPLLPKDHEFSFIIGSDQLPRFTEWHGYQELLAAMRFLVFPRLGHPVDPLQSGMQIVDHTEFLVTTDISSTKIRERVFSNLPIGDFVDPRVEQYIYDHGLYREGRVDKEKS